MRESGYYRVKYDGKQIIAMYTLINDKIYIGGKWVDRLGYWSLCGKESEYEDSDFEAIDENRIDPEPEVNITGTANYIIDIKHVRGDEV